MAVLLVGRQCCVSKSAMERYDARFCRNSTMTSLAGIKSWNFCGRSGVNSATALRMAPGSNVFIIWNGLNVNGETCQQPYAQDDAATRTVLCQSRFVDNPGSRRVSGRG